MPSVRCRRPRRPIGRLRRTSPAIPDGGAEALRRALGERHGLPPERVVPGNGADELIRLCGAAVLDAGDAAVFPWPSFPSYLAAAAVHGAAAVRVPLRAGAFDLDAVLEACRRPSPAGGRVRVVYLANPNNPTGTLIPAADVRAFLDALPERILCVLDEAYAEYADEEPEGPALVREGHGRLCVLRTFSKVYGLAALRVGYALASPEVADALDRVRPIFNLNQPAQDAALASLAEARRGGGAGGARRPGAGRSCGRSWPRRGCGRSRRRPTSSTPTRRTPTATGWPSGCSGRASSCAPCSGFGARGRFA